MRRGRGAARVCGSIAVTIAGSTVLAQDAATAAASNLVVRAPDVVVVERKVREEAPVGPYDQPEWTTRRRFPTTRVYLQDQPWQVEFEQWWRGRFYRDDSSEHLFQEEITMGLPHRLQVDLYENWARTDDGTYQHDSLAAELRYAFADWRRIPLNPTVYAEWKFVDGGPDVYELKLLLGEELAPRWHWGFNAVYEQEVGGERATEFAASQAFSYTVIDQKLGVGIEMKYVNETEEGSRGSPEEQFLLGPSVQWRPSHRFHVDAVPLFNLADDGPRVECFIVAGWDFGTIVKPAAAPRSLQSE